MSGARRGGRRGAVVALAFAALFAVAPSAAWADGTATAPPSAAEAPTGDLEHEMLRRPGTLVALVTLKFVPALVGVLLLILERSRASDARRGLAPPLPPPRPPPPVSIPMPWMLLALALFVVIPTPILYLLSPQDPAGAPTWMHVVATGVAGLVLAAAILAGRHARIAAGATKPVGPGRALRDALRTFCVAAAGVFAVGLVAKFALPPIVHVEPDSQDIVKQVVRAPGFDVGSVVLFGVFVAPFTEECLFRGMVYPALRGATRPMGAAVASSALFAVMHYRKPADVYTCVVLFVLAMFLARLYERTSSLLATTLVHALNNATTFVPLLMLRS